MFDIFKIKYYREQTVMNTSILCNVNLITVTLSLKEKPPNYSFLLYVFRNVFVFPKRSPRYFEFYLHFCLIRIQGLLISAFLLPPCLVHG